MLIDGEIAGTWRAKRSGKRRAITATPFETITPRVRAAITAEAELVVTIRGATEVTVLIDGS